MYLPKLPNREAFLHHFMTLTQMSITSLTHSEEPILNLTTVQFHCTDHK